MRSFQVLYIHLLYGRPAYFNGKQLRHVPEKPSRANLRIYFVGSLRTIKQQQALSSSWRHKMAYKNISNQYSWTKLRVPEDRERWHKG